mmetsp:Transcript_9266/g.25817  ORF Transcript_9266/g.25817 Transcript_9266/m.25817 type:complete len:241 (+) Transcript_9266:3122-3844(+)
MPAARQHVVRVERRPLRGVRAPHKLRIAPQRTGLRPEQRTGERGGAQEPRQRQVHRPRLQGSNPALLQSHIRRARGGVLLREQGRRVAHGGRREGVRHGLQARHPTRQRIRQRVRPPSQGAHRTERRRRRRGVASIGVDPMPGEERDRGGAPTRPRAVRAPRGRRAGAERRRTGACAGDVRRGAEGDSMRGCSARMRASGDRARAVRRRHANDGGGDPRGARERPRVRRARARALPQAGL